MLTAFYNALSNVSRSTTSCVLRLTKSSFCEHAGDRPSSMVHQLFGVCFRFHPCVIDGSQNHGLSENERLRFCIKLLSDPEILCESVPEYLVGVVSCVFLFAFPNCSLLPFRLPFFFRIMLCLFHSQDNGNSPSLSISTPPLSDIVPLPLSPTNTPSPQVAYRPKLLSRPPLYSRPFCNGHRDCRGTPQDVPDSSK